MSKSKGPPNRLRSRPSRREHRETKSTRRPIYIASAILVAALAAAVAAKIRSVDSSGRTAAVSDTTTTTSTVAGPPKSPPVPECRGQDLPGCVDDMPEPRSDQPFVFEGFKPSEEGVVIYSRFKGAGKKTVIYLPDNHENESGSGREKTHKTQLALLALVKQLTDTYGQIPVVLEDVLIGTRLENMVDAYRADPAAISVSKGGQGMLAFIEELASDRSVAQKREAIKKLFANGDIGVGLYLLYIMDREIIPLFTQGLGNMDYSMEVYERWKSSHIARKSKKVTCSLFTKNPSDTTTLAATVDQFSNPHHTGPVSRCYCYIRGLVNRAIETMIYDRTVSAAQREAKTALKSKGDVVVIISGVAHGIGVVDELVKEDVNVLVVAPRVIEADARALLTRRWGEDLLPDPQGSCGNVWSQGQ